MLDEMDPADLDEWYASYLLDPWDQEWEQAGTIAAEIRNFRRLLFAGLAKETLEEKELTEADDFSPKLVFGKQKEEPEHQTRSDTIDIKTDEENMQRIYGDGWQPWEP